MLFKWINHNFVFKPALENKWPTVLKQNLSSVFLLSTAYCTGFTICTFLFLKAQQHRERDLNLRRIIYENIQHLILQLGDKQERDKPYPEPPQKKLITKTKNILTQVLLIQLWWSERSNNRNTTLCQAKTSEVWLLQLKFEGKRGKKKQHIIDKVILKHILFTKKIHTF